MPLSQTGDACVRSTNDVFLGGEGQREVLTPGSKGTPLTTQ
jgi:hypothetical protein